MRRRKVDLEDTYLLEKAREEDEEQAKELLFERYHYFLNDLAREYQSPRLPYREAYQVAALGFMKALRRFNPEKGSSLKAFAQPYIEGELKKYYRDKARLIRVPRRLRNLGIKAEALRRKMYRKERREPTIHELANGLGEDEEEVMEALAMKQKVPPLSLNVGLSDERDTKELSSAVGSNDSRYKRIEEKILLSESIEALPTRLRLVLELRLLEWSQQRIADEVGVSQMQVSRLERKAIKKVREMIRT